MKKKSTLRRVLNVVGVVIMLALAGFLAFIVISNAGGNVTFVAGKTVVWVRTDSMEPTIPAQSYVLMEEADPAELQIGDVIMFKSTDPTLGGAMNTHRIIGTDDRGWFITKGDNNLKEDDKRVNPLAVKGRYLQNLPLLTKAGRFLSKPGGIVVMILVLLAITAAAFAPDFIAGFREKEKEKKQSEMDELVRAEVERMKSEAEKKPEGEKDPAPEEGRADKEEET